VNAQLDCVRVCFVFVDDEFSFILVFDYFEKFEKIVVYLSTLRKSVEMNQKKFNKFKKKVLRFKLQNNQFFRRNSKNVSLRRIVDDLKKQQLILK
jgi:hypothetical protein